MTLSKIINPMATGQVLKMLMKSFSVIQPSYHCPQTIPSVVHTVLHEHMWFLFTKTKTRYAPLTTLQEFTNFIHSQKKMYKTFHILKYYITIAVLIYTSKYV